MTKCKNWLLRACTELGLSIELDFAFPLSDGRKLKVLARIVGLGASNGMLLVSTAKVLEGGVSEEILRADYGYSVIDEPRPDEEFDLDSFRDMFVDWGWCGEPSKQPHWMC